MVHIYLMYLLIVFFLFIAVLAWTVRSIDKEMESAPLGLDYLEPPYLKTSKPELAEPTNEDILGLDTATPIIPTIEKQNGEEFKAHNNKFDVDVDLQGIYDSLDGFDFNGHQIKKPKKTKKSKKKTKKRKKKSK